MVWVSNRAATRHAPRSNGWLNNQDHTQSSISDIRYSFVARESDERIRNMSADRNSEPLIHGDASTPRYTNTLLRRGSEEHGHTEPKRVVRERVSSIISTGSTLLVTYELDNELCDGRGAHARRIRGSCPKGASPRRLALWQCLFRSRRLETPQKAVWYCIWSVSCTL